MNSTLLKYDLFLSMISATSIKESMKIEDLILESRSEGLRIVDYLQENSVNENLELDLLNENEKWEFENKIWEGAHFYATNSPQLFEGFWKNLIGGIKNLSKKALNVAKSILTGIGKIIKSCAQYCLKFIEAVKEKGKAAAASVWNSIKKPIDDKFADKMGKYTTEELEKEGEEWSSTVDWITGKGTDAGLKKGFADASEIKSEIESQSSEERDEMLRAIADKEKGMKESSDDVYNYSVTRVMNEMRSNKNFDIQDLSEYASMYNEIDNFYKAELGISEHDEIDRGSLKTLKLNEGIFDKFTNFVTGKGWNEDDAAERTEKQIEKAKEKSTEVPDPSAVHAEKKKSRWERFKSALSLSSIISIIVSGVVSLFEKLADYIFKGAFQKVSSWVKKFGGPGVFTFAVISGILAVAVGLIAEFGMNTLAKYTGNETFEEIGHALHSFNPSYWIEKGVNLILPGMGTVLGVAAKITCLGLAVNHVIHVFSHNRNEIDHKKAKDLEKEEVNKIQDELDNGKSLSDEQKVALTDLKHFRTANIEIHNKMKKHEHDIHHLHDEIAEINKNLKGYRSEEEEKKWEAELKEKEKELERIKEMRKIGLNRLRARKDKFKELRNALKAAKK